MKLFSHIALRVSDELYNLDNEQIQACLEHSCQWPLDTGKSFSEALILASNNPQYDNRLFVELQVQYMKIPSSEHVVYINCSECQNINKKSIFVHNMF